MPLSELGATASAEIVPIIETAGIEGSGLSSGFADSAGVGMSGVRELGASALSKSWWQRPITLGFGVWLFAFIIRLLHLTYAANSPLTFQVGPDEDYYLRFARDVAFGSVGLLSEFAFMDPLYGYLLGAVLAVSNGSVFSMYLLQSVIDAATAAMLVVIGRDVGQARAGWLAGLIYAVLGPSIAITSALLKETWVAAYFCGWVLIGFLARKRGGAIWLAFGAYCGLGVALRSNLLLLLPFALMLPYWRDHRWPPPNRVLAATGLVVGLIPVLAILIWRNHMIDGRWSPMPTNGGVVLHQLYNAENPKSASRYPSFVRYGHPSEALRAYRTEAERRHRRAMTVAEVDAYWKSEALGYVLAHPVQTIRNGLRKLAEFSAWPEVPNNRSYADERMFSPVLRMLPPPFGILFALGVPGLILLGRQRQWLVWPPVVTGVATIAVFFAEDRFRLVVVPFFALGAGVWLVAWIDAWRDRRHAFLGAAVVVSLVLGGWSAAWATRMPVTPSNWQRIATGWIKMAEYDRAEALLAEVAKHPENARAVDEFLGLIALRRHDPQLARQRLSLAVQYRQDRHEVWHNYALALAQTGDVKAAIAAELSAYALVPTPEYAFAVARLMEADHRTEEALDIYQRLAADAVAGEFGEQARRRIDAIRVEGLR